MALTLSPSHVQLTYPDDFPADRCRIDVLSEYPDPGPGAPLLRLEVASGPFLLSTSTVSESKMVHEFGHARQQGMRRFAVKLTVLLDPNADASVPRRGQLSFSNGTDLVQLSIDTVAGPPPPIEVLTLAVGKTRLKFGRVTPQLQKTEALSLTANLLVNGVADAGRTVPVVVTVEPTGGAFTVSADGQSFSDQVTLLAGAGGNKAFVRYAPTAEGDHSATVRITANEASEVLPVAVTGSAGIRKLPVWPWVLLGIMGLGLLMWLILPNLESPPTSSGVSTQTPEQVPPADSTENSRTPVSGPTTSRQGSGTKPAPSASRQVRKTKTNKPTPGKPTQSNDPENQNAIRVVPNPNRQ